jgi:hypothetical protein
MPPGKLVPELDLEPRIGDNSLVSLSQPVYESSWVRHELLGLTRTIRRDKSGTSEPRFCGYLVSTESNGKATRTRRVPCQKAQNSRLPDLTELREKHKQLDDSMGDDDPVRYNMKQGESQGWKNRSQISNFFMRR